MSEVIKEKLFEWFTWTHAKAGFRNGRVAGKYLGKQFSVLNIPYIAVKSVITNSLKPFRQNVLNHSSNKFEYGNCFMHDTVSFVISIPICNKLSVILFNTSN